MHASDLDIRYVLTASRDKESIQKEFSELTKRLWLEKYKQESDIFGYIDAQYSCDSPSEYNSSRIL